MSNEYYSLFYEAIALYRLMNRLQPNSIRKIRTGQDVFNPMENVINFREQCANYGLDEHDIFSTNALWQLTDFPSVVDTLIGLSIVVRLCLDTFVHCTHVAVSH